MWIIYGIDVLSNLSLLAFVIFLVSAIVLFIMLMICGDNNWRYDEQNKLFKKAFITILSVALLLVFIPDKKTMYLMVGAYATEKIVETPEAKEFGSKLLNVVNHKLDKMLEDEETKKEKK